MNCNINKNNIPIHLWDTLSKIPIIWYMLPPVNTLQELYDKYDERDLVENNLVYGEKYRYCQLKEVAHELSHMPCAWDIDEIADIMDR